MTTKPTRAVAYCRVSRDEQASNFSLPTQAEACGRYAEANGYKLVETFFEDYTGTKIHRPEMEKVLGMVRAGQVDVVLAYSTDRLTRGGNFALGWFLTEFAEYGARCELIEEP